MTELEESVIKNSGDFASGASWELANESCPWEVADKIRWVLDHEDQLAVTPLVKVNGYSPTVFSKALEWLVDTYRMSNYLMQKEVERMSHEGR